MQVQVDSGDGANVVAMLIGTGGAPGLSLALADRPAHHTVTALANTSGVVVTGARLRQLIAHRPQILRWWVHLLADLQLTVEAELACSAAHHTEQRLARLLLSAHHRPGRNRIELRQEDLAQMLGVQRSTVSTLAHGFKVRKLLNCTRGTIRIVDPAGLAAISCRCADAGTLLGESLPTA